ncbi:YcaO-like family protein [Paracoccus aminophilus]|uniref:YcaO domain-containing protein n=1 Tax=Paracoccus aminophilus JCM 7686 TaxID=1367847 RepID=S5YHK8_PARAH|nr:YcaO-like family protein [Paracoccus aminophilus]AGT10948.1 hypothetical protein JCM7686_pAMI4p258 [Paracoccus aminophilus JCM 7686]
MQIAGQDLSAQKAYFDGTHRLCEPAETIARVTPHLARMGITRVADITGLDRIGLPVSVAIRPNARALSTSQGKGRTREAAQASALMESIEGWHGERISLPLRIESWNTMASERDLPDPLAFGLRADAHLDPALPLVWAKVWDLMTESPAWVPYETLSTAFVESEDQRPLLLKTTNGLASGNHLLEAIVHALFELIERDALTLASLARAPRRFIAQDMIPDPYFQALAARLDKAGIVMVIEDVTSDLAVPTFTCEMIDDPRRGNWRALPSASGHGTHSDFTVALSRAVHEAIQSRVTIISGSRDDLFPHDYADALSLEAQLALTEAANRTQSWMPPILPTTHMRFEDELQALLDRLRALGIDHAYLADLSRDDVGIPVVKLVVPGLEPPRSAVYRPGARAASVTAAAAKGRLT